MTQAIDSPDCRRSSLAVDVITTMGAQRDCAAEAVDVAIIITTMYGGRHGVIAQQVGEMGHV
jgi:hypothetical protein